MGSVSRSADKDSYFRSIFEHSFDAILLTVPDGKILAANPAACKMFGRSEEEICSLGRAGIVDHSYPGLKEALVSRNEKGEYRGTIRYLRSDGIFFMGETSSKVFLNEKGEERTSMIIRDITDQIAADHELKRRETLLSLFVAHAPAAIAMFDRNMNYIAVSERFLKDYGIPERNIIGKSHYEVFPELPEAWKEVHKRCLKGAVEKAETEAFMRLDGSVDWINWEIHPWHDYSGEVGGLLLFSEDLTEFINLRNELRSSEQRWRFALEGAGDGVWDWDCITNEVFYSSQWKRMLGFGEEEIEPTLNSWRSVIQSEEDDSFKSLYYDILKGTDLEFSKEHQVRTKQGTLKWILNRGMAFGRAADGAPLRVIGTITDITEMKMAQETLRQNNRMLTNSENRYRTLFETSSEGIFIVEITTGKIKFVNPTICRMLGYGEEELLQSTINGLFHAADWDEVVSEIRDHFDGIKTQSSDLKFRKRDGYTLHMDLTSAKTVIDGTQVLVVFASDITERLVAEEERSQYANRMLSAMIKTVELLSKTVELKDPYTAGLQLRVASLADAIARELGMSDEEAEGIRMAAIVHDLGKMYVPSEILSKPGKLNLLEFNLVKTHAQAGYDILKEVDFPWPIADMVLQHHERMNGTGYPNGVMGAEMNLGARIIAVADVVESMASYRPYRPSLGIEAALAEIDAHSGTLFDPVVVAACKALFKRGYVLAQVE
ncbi:MAG: PAS domain S-box protein [Acidaminobacter sp.]|uniref:PAS domain S-box protein n=1 Tax=Acidaminobacter sp. TaxID=1872102 RepID=UPI00137D2261|nr:PAS domain S-box protein [Acidaminobacter sp.]MZQ99640.1 PAS domain S-box protein [Acidaminobacter sp.]